MSIRTDRESDEMPSPSTTLWPRVSFAGLPADLLTTPGAMAIVDSYGSRTHGSALAVVSANLDHIHHFRTDHTWAARRPAALDDPFPDTADRLADHAAPAVDSSEGRQDSGPLHWLTLLDGAPLTREASVMTGQAWPRLAGSDLIEPMLRLAEERGWRVGFLGGTVEAQNALAASMPLKFPALTVAGYWAPARADLSDPTASTDLAARIADSQVHVLVVGLGKPRQEQWIADYGQLTGARVLLAFGAVVDFLSGRITRAPRWASDNGIEWAWRLTREPRRLARRYLIQGPSAYLQLRRSGRLFGATTLVDVIPNVALPPAPARPGHHRFAGPDEPVDVNAVVVTYNSGRDLPGLLESLRIEAAHLRIRVIICDNASSDDTVEIARRTADVTVLAAGGNVGYAAGINIACRAITHPAPILVLNPDLVVLPRAVECLLQRLHHERAGAVVPVILDADGHTYHSLRREPSALRALGDALVGRRWPGRPAWLSEFDQHPASYTRTHHIHWSTGAAILIDHRAAAAVGAWDESYFLYSEETDYFRRLRDNGWAAYFEPAAVVQHRGGGSGTSEQLAVLMAVNKVRYAERHLSPGAARRFRAATVLGELLRCTDSTHRRTAAALVHRASWARLPGTPVNRRVTRTGPPDRVASGGAVVIPAHNEAVALGRTLAPLADAAAAGRLQVVVVVNGSTDGTAAVAQTFAGVQVVELAEAGKTAALNAGDRTATGWPRLYLDADILVTEAAVAEVFAELQTGQRLAARPTYRYDCTGADRLVRRYYRARRRVSESGIALWGAGAYAIGRAGHERFGSFPTIVADDLFVDAQFAVGEKSIVPTEPVIVRTPRTRTALLSVLRRTTSANTEFFAGTDAADRQIGPSTRQTMQRLLKTVRGPGSALDAAVYVGFAVAARLSRSSAGDRDRWARDETSRT